MPTFQDALQEFAQLLRGTSKDIIQKNRVLVRDVCKQLNESLVAPPSSLVQFLESDKTKKKIEKYIQRSAEQAVTRKVELKDLDLRLLDVEWAETHRDDQTRFRKGLGERSLGLQYHEWETQTFQRSRLDDLCEGSENYNTGEGNIARFIKAHGFPEKSYVEKAIRTGTRLLLLDHYAGTEGASAVVSFAPTRFRDVTYPDLKDLAASLQGNAWIASLMQTIAQWIEDCRAIYDGQIRPRKRNRSACYGNGHTGQKKRGRREGNATMQMDNRDGEASSSIQSRRTPGGNSISRQVIDASAYTRNTFPNTREETGVNQLQHPGCTAPVHGMPPSASFSVLDPATSGGRAETESTLDPQRYIDYPGASPMTSSDRVESATLGIADRQICTLPPLQEITEQSAEGRHTPTRFPLPGLTAMGRQGGDVHNLHLQWLPDAELVRRQETAAGTASFRPSPNANNATLTEADEALLQPRAADFPESQAQTYFSAHQGYGDVGAGGPAWDGTPYNTQGEGWDVGFWGANFSF